MKSAKKEIEALRAELKELQAGGCWVVGHDVVHPKLVVGFSLEILATFGGFCKFPMLPL